jgi:hypothetical protein
MNATERGDEMETSLSQLTESEWNEARNRWARGIDGCVEKVGKKWSVSPAISSGFPLFKTKREAGEAADRLVLLESKCRLHKTLLTEGKVAEAEALELRMFE